MELSGWVVAFALLFLFCLLSYKGWMQMWNDQRMADKHDKRLRELMDDLPPLSNGRRPR